MRSASFAFALIAIVLTPAMLSAQATPAAPAAPSASMAALLDAGYEIRAVTPMTADEQKLVWPNDPVTAFSLVTLQKGKSIGVCALPTSSLIRMDTNVTENTKICRTH